MSTDTSGALDQPVMSATTPQSARETELCGAELRHQGATNNLDRSRVEPCSTTSCPPDDVGPEGIEPATRAARRTVITAITTRIAHQRLTAAQAAAVLHLTGPRVTRLFNADIDEFTLDELINLLPALDLILQVVPAPPQDVGDSA